MLLIIVYVQRSDCKVNPFSPENRYFSPSLRTISL